jgi:restriction endonuclease S subunit
VRVRADKIKVTHWLKGGEILVSNRGVCKVAVNRCRYPCVASGVFFVLTVQDKNFLPEYLAVFLNSQEGQKALMIRQNVSGVLSINRGELEQVEIPLISLEKQRQIVELYALYEKETDILEQIKKTRKRLINSVLSQMVKE